MLADGDGIERPELGCVGARGAVAAAQLADITECYLKSRLEQWYSANSSSLSEVLTPELILMTWKGMFSGLFSSIASNGAELELLQPCSCVLQVSGAELGKLRLCSSI